MAFVWEIASEQVVWSLPTDGLTEWEWLPDSSAVMRVRTADPDAIEVYAIAQDD